MMSAIDERPNRMDGLQFNGIIGHAHSSIASFHIVFLFETPLIYDRIRR